MSARSFQSKHTPIATKMWLVNYQLPNQTDDFTQPDLQRTFSNQSQINKHILFVYTFDSVRLFWTFREILLRISGASPQSKDLNWCFTWNYRFIWKIIENIDSVKISPLVIFALITDMWIDHNKSVLFINNFLFKEQINSLKTCSIWFWLE